MSEVLDQIVAQLNTLSPKERAELARVVLLSLETEEAGVEEAWDLELARRVDRIRNGEAVAIPADRVFAEWRQNRS